MNKGRMGNRNQPVRKVQGDWRRSRIPGKFVENARYSHDRRDALAARDKDSIDKPIVDIVAGFASLPHCFTLQCCHGHFICAPEQDPSSLEPISRGYAGLVRYRVAYIAFCLGNNHRGRSLRVIRGRNRIQDAHITYDSLA
jgi:hypothetical protein